MRLSLAALLVLAAPFAWSQPASDPKPVTPPASKAAACDECGVVTSIRTMTKDTAPVEQVQGKPSGLVASIPLGGGSPRVGSSTKIGRDVPTVSQSWEVIVKLDDGRYRVVVLDSQPDVAKGDRVRVKDGKLASP